jgi:hypothetical protein
MKRCSPGEDLLITGQVVDKLGSPVNIAGWTLGFWAFDKADHASTISQTTGFTFPDAATGKWSLVIDRATTTGKGGKTYEGFVWRTDNGSNSVLSYGDIDILENARP